MSSSCSAAALSGAGDDQRSSAGACIDDDRLAPAAGELGADVIGHAPRGDLDQPAARVVGHAFARPLHRRREQRFLHRVLGGGEVAEAADHRAEHLRRQLAQQVLAGDVQPAVRHTSTGGALITSRTSMRHVQRDAALARRRGGPRGDLVGPLGALDVDDPVAGEELLGLGERTVGDLGRARLCRRARSAPAPAAASPSAATSSPAFGQLLRRSAS